MTIIKNPTTSTTTTNTAQPTTGGAFAAEDNLYMFVIGWVFLIIILTFINKSRLGHVIIYYSLLMMIIVILLAEYQQYQPFLGAIQTIGQFNAGSVTSGSQGAA